LDVLWGSATTNTKLGVEASVDIVSITAAPDVASAWVVEVRLSGGTVSGDKKD